MKNDALKIINAAIEAANPYYATLEALSRYIKPDGCYTVMSIGKAAVSMAAAAEKLMKNSIKQGLIVTKYGHTGDFSSHFFDIIEAGHPVSDNNSILAAEKALDIAKNLTKDDTLIVLLSGGGSALLEKSTVTPDIQREITLKLLKRGAAIDEINAVRRRLSLIKGGRLAFAALPAKTITFSLSDVLSNDKCVIASGPTVNDTASDSFVKGVAQKYLADVPKQWLNALYAKNEVPELNGEYYFVGDIHSLITAAVNEAQKLGYCAECVSDSLTGEASLRAAEIVNRHINCTQKTAFIYGGETTVTLKGSGMGGRNQEMALAAAIAMEGKSNIVFASCGSDGTDGPTDAAGGIVDGNTAKIMRKNGVEPAKELQNNNSYFALKAAGALLITGPTGTNVNDLTFLLCNK